MVETTTRNATLEDLASMLRDQQARKVDIVAPASQIRMIDGDLAVRGAVPVLEETGVTQADGRYRPTDVCDEGLAEKLGIPIQYLRRLRESRVDLLGKNVNGWLHGMRKTSYGGEVLVDIPGDGRSFLLRCFKADDTPPECTCSRSETLADHDPGCLVPAGMRPGIARAFLSDRFGMVDNLDVLTACMDGVAAAGVQIDIEGCDLSDRRMMVRISTPEVRAMAPTLLKGYRSPFTGQSGDDNPIVFAGLEISNSEVGGGAFIVVPRIVVQICSNGMKITKDAARHVHLGSRLDPGIVQWSEETQRANLDVIRGKTKDSVATFLSADYLERAADDIDREAGRPVDSVDEVRRISKALTYTTEQTDGILAMFIRGGSMSAGGVVNAVTAYAQTVGDADAAYDLESSALRVLDVV